MFKSLSSCYQHGKRSYGWIKVKKDYLSTTTENNSGIFLPDSLDLVVIGAFWGIGKRKGLFGSFLMAVRHNDTYQTVGKLGTGFTDVDLKDLTTSLQENTSDTKPKMYDIRKNATIPDVWFHPKQVWEVKATQLTLSKSYTAAMNHLNDDLDSGLSMRFPRFLKLRPDKNVFQATSSKEIFSMYTTSSSLL